MTTPTMVQQATPAIRPPGQIQPQQGGNYSQSQSQLQQQQPNTNLDPDQKKIQDIIDALTFIGNIREDINIILDNVGKSNSSNNFSSIYASKVSLKQSFDTNLIESNKNQNNGQDQNEQDQITNNEFFDKFLNMDSKQQQFLEKADTKYLQDRIVDFNKNLT